VAFVIALVLNPNAAVASPLVGPWGQWKWYLLAGAALLALQAGLIVALLVHRAARHQAQLALADRLRFEALLSGLSTTFVALSDAEIDREIEKALERIVEELGLDRAGLAEYDSGGDRVRVTRSWTRPGIAPAPRTLAVDAFPWIRARLREGRVVALRSADDLPAEAVADRVHLAEMGTRALVAVPLTIRGATVGALWFSARHEERDWPEERLQRFQMLGQVFANTLARRRAEGAVHESEARFRSMADTAPVLIWMSGTDKRCTFFNKAWLDFTGRTLEEELGAGWVRGLHPDDVDRCLGTHVTAFDTRQAFSLEYRLRRNDGEYRWILDKGVPRFAPDGEFLGYIGCATDITQPKRAEERPRQVLEAAPNAMIMMTKEGRIALVNAAAEAVFGYARDELIGRPIELLIPDRLRAQHPGYRKDYFAAPNVRTMGAGRELFGRRKDGREVPVEIGLTPIETSDGVFALASIIDITARKEAELAAQRHRSELAHVTRIATMGELAASLAHELNQPLTAILSNAQAALRLLDADPGDLEEIREILKDIVEDDSRASEVIRRLRAFVRKEPLEVVPVDLASIIQEVVLLVHSDAILRASRVSVDLKRALPLVWGDKVQLQQVVVNLLLNAFDAMKEIPPSERKVTVRAELDGERTVRVVVSDRGTGLSRDEYDKVFQPFYTTKREGLGMGLSISRSIIEAHGGRLWAENNVDRGATFYFTIVRADDGQTGNP